MHTLFVCSSEGMSQKLERGQKLPVFVLLFGSIPTEGSNSPYSLLLIN